MHTLHVYTSDACWNTCIYTSDSLIPFQHLPTNFGQKDPKVCQTYMFKFSVWISYTCWEKIYIWLLETISASTSNHFKNKKENMDEIWMFTLHMHTSYVLEKCICLIFWHHFCSYGMATISRLLKIIGLFCRI